MSICCDSLRHVYITTQYPHLSSIFISFISVELFFCFLCPTFIRPADWSLNSVAAATIKFNLGSWEAIRYLFYCSIRNEVRVISCMCFEVDKDVNQYQWISENANRCFGFQLRVPLSFYKSSTLRSHAPLMVPFPEFGSHFSDFGVLMNF